MTTHPLFSVHTLRPFHAFSKVLDFIEAELSIYENVQHFIWSKDSDFNFTAVRYSLLKCSEMMLCINRQFVVHVSSVSCALKFIEARKLATEFGPRSGLFLTLESFAIKIILSRLPICWSSELRAVTLLVIVRCNRRVPDRLLKRVAMVFRVRSGYVELLLTYWCPWSATICQFWEKCV